MGIVIPNPAIYLLPEFQDLAANLETTLSLPNALPHGAYAEPTSDGFLLFLPSCEETPTDCRLQPLPCPPSSLHVHSCPSACSTAHAAQLSQMAFCFSCMHACIDSRGWLLQQVVCVWCMP